MTTIVSSTANSGTPLCAAGKRLCLNSYTPNFNDRRTQQRVRSVLEWCGTMLLQKRARSINHKVLRKVFGNTSQGLGRWLYSNLLIQTGSYAARSHSFSYSLNKSGYEKLHRMLNIQAPTSVSLIRETYPHIVSGAEIPQYVDRGGRRFHAIQNMKREDRKVVFKGWWDYDIEACAPTLVYQYALAAYYAANKNSSALPFPAVARLIESKIEMREHVAAVAKIDIEKAKELLHSLFFKARLSPHSACAVYQLLNEDRLRYELLKNDPFIKALRTDVRRVWTWATHQDKVERAKATFNDGIARPHSRSGAKHRNAIYIMLERKVMRAIEEWFPNGVLPGILMHDGFMSRVDVSVEVLECHVKETTGYSIKLKKQRLIPDTERFAQDDKIGGLH
jgi:hypothetical protein